MTFEAVVARAGELDVDFLLVAGNLFDHQPSEEELVCGSEFSHAAL